MHCYLQTVEEEALIKNNNTCKDFLIEAMKYHLLPLDQRLLIKNPRTKPRTPVSLPKVSPSPAWAMAQDCPRKVASTPASVCSGFRLRLGPKRWCLLAPLEFASSLTARSLLCLESQGGHSDVRELQARAYAVPREAEERVCWIVGVRTPPVWGLSLPGKRYEG